jgi:hypothetical protein
MTSQPAASHATARARGTYLKNRSGMLAPSGLYPANRAFLGDDPVAALDAVETNT